MHLPNNTALPFFAYGIFRPGQLGFFQLKDLVCDISDLTYVAGTLLLRDGLPIIDPSGNGQVRGRVLEFIPEKASEAYSRICALEPDKHYQWAQAQAAQTNVNVLLGRSPRKGSVDCEDEEWDCWDDPLFTSAIDVVDETLRANSQFEWDLKPLFRLQMAYLLLWSSIERYVSLRYHFGDRVMEKINQLAHETAFANGLLEHVKGKREVYRADRPDHKVLLDPQSPDKALAYYYQIRSNITHRGKAVIRDHDRILDALSELLSVFRKVLSAARSDSATET